MSPVYVVIGLGLILRGLGAIDVLGIDTWLDAARWSTGLTFVVMGGAHLTPLRHDVARLVPPSVHRPALVVTILGIWQIAGGIGLITPFLRSIAAAALIVLLLLKLPANIRIARESLTLPGRMATSPAWRVPAQFLWIGLVWWSGS